MKIAFLGAGSIGFTRKLVADLLTVPELRDAEIAFMDIDPQNLRMVAELVRRDIAHNGLTVPIHTTLCQREAIEGARYIVNTARVGRLEAFKLDVDIPLKYGVDQCVGDTICTGGVFYGQRGIPYILGVCKDIREVAEKDALLLNYGNPNAMLTWAANVYGGVQCLGLCHGVQGGHAMIARAFGLPVKDVDIVCAGINHQTWYVQIRHGGEDLTGKLLDALSALPDVREDEKARLDVLRNFGYFATESNGHFSEYVSWYRKRPEELDDWISYSSWIQGQTGGYLRVCTESRNWFESDFPAWMAEPPMEYTPESRSSEHGSYIVESLETGRLYRGHFNVMNRGAIANLPDECVVEVPGYIDGNGINIPRVGDLPLGCAAICSQSVWVQKLAVEAAVHADRALLVQALLMDPLTGAVCTPPEIRQMADEMLIAQAAWLPQYIASGEIEKAKARLSAEYKPPRFQGVDFGHRLPVRDYREVAKERSTRVSAEEKALELDKAQK